MSFKSAITYSITAVLTVLILTIGGYEWHKSYMIYTAIQNGIDPIKARCGIKGANNNPTMAILCSLVCQGENRGK